MPHSQILHLNPVRDHHTSFLELLSSYTSVKKHILNVAVRAYFLQDDETPPPNPCDAPLCYRTQECS